MTLKSFLNEFFLNLHHYCYYYYSNELAESLFPELQESLSVLLYRKPDIVVLDRISRICLLLKLKFVLICISNMLALKKLNVIHCYWIFLTKMVGMWNSFSCFGSLGCVKDDVWKCLQKLNFDKFDSKELMNWCSISNMVM